MSARDDDAARIDAVAQAIEAETHARGAALDADPARRRDALVAVERVRQAYAKGGAHPVLCDQLTDASALLITREELLVELQELRAQVDALHAERDRLHHELRIESVTTDGLREDRDALRVLFDGRTVPPTAAEIRAHAADGGAWVITAPGRWVTVHDAERVAQVERVATTEAPYVRRWLPLDRDGRPCAWPTVAEDGAP